MKPTSQHIPGEELMALADGELSAKRIATVTEHVKECADCRRTTVETEESQHLVELWAVEEMPPEAVERMRSRINATSGRVGAFNESRKSLGLWKGLTVGVAAGCVILMIFAVATPNLLRSRMAANEASAVGSLRTLNTAAATYRSSYGEYPPSLRSLGPPASGEASAAAADLIDSVLATGEKSGYFFKYRRAPGVPGRGGYEINAYPAQPGKSGIRRFSTDQTGVIRMDGKAVDGTTSNDYERDDRMASASGADPMIARSAELKLVVTSAESARGSVDALVKQYGGYVAQLSATSDEGTVPVIVALLRVPQERMEDCLRRLKALGRATRESQAGEELGRSHLDLVARLKNARNTETRINELIQKRTGNVKEVLAAESEAARVRGEIEQMDAARKAMEERVEFATISLTLSEVYKAQLETSVPGAGTRLRNALVGGFRDAWESGLGLLVWVVSVLPSAALWVGILFVPARWGWRRWRTSFSQI